MKDNEKEARMQTKLDQCWKAIEGYCLEVDSFFEALEFFRTTAKPNSPQNLAVLCISLVGMQVNFNGFKRAVENEEM